MFKKGYALPLLAVVFLLSAGQVSAHATVKPAEVGVGKYQTFTVAVPSEKPIATIGIRLVVPEGIVSITPNVKPGWKITKKLQATGNQVKDHDGKMVAEQKLVEVSWTGGRIPDGQRDEFLFSAKAPSQSTELNWKVYQTYADGSVVAWELDPSQPQPKDAVGNMNFSASGPYSITKVIDDLSSSSTPAVKSNSNSTTALGFSVVAFVLALAALNKAGKKN